MITPYNNKNKSISSNKPIRITTFVHARHEGAPRAASALRGRQRLVNGWGVFT